MDTLHSEKRFLSANDLAAPAPWPLNRGHLMNAAGQTVKPKTNQPSPLGLPAGRKIGKVGHDEL